MEDEGKNYLTGIRVCYLHGRGEEEEDGEEERPQ
jgi:hypothetical protein